MQLHTLLNVALEGDEWSAACFGYYTHRANSLRYPLNWRLCWPQIRTDASVMRKPLKVPKIELIIPSRPIHRLFTKGAQIPCTRSAWRLNFVRWHLVVMGPQYGTCFTSSFWCLKFWGISYIFRQYRTPATRHTSWFPRFQKQHHQQWYKQQEQRSNGSSRYKRILTIDQIILTSNRVGKPECMRSCCVQACLNSVTSHRVDVTESRSGTLRRVRTFVYNFPHARLLFRLHLPGSPLGYVPL